MSGDPRPDVGSDIGQRITEGIDRLKAVGAWTDARNDQCVAAMQSVRSTQDRLEVVGARMLRRPGDRLATLRCLAAAREFFRAYGDLLAVADVGDVAARYHSTALLPDHELLAVWRDLDSLEVPEAPPYSAN